MARPLHDSKSLACDPESPTGPAGSALSWQLTDPAHEGVVRERFGLSFQPGEIRVCASCHGVNQLDQAGQPPPANKPAALIALLQSWSACAPGVPLLRKDTVTSIRPITPALNLVLPLDAMTDVHVPSFANGGLDPESMVLRDATRPLVFYGMAGSQVLKLTRAVDAIRITY